MFRKMNMTTKHELTFGEKPRAQEDFKVLEEKNFSQLPIAQIIKPNIRNMISNWLKMNDQDKFTGRIFFTVRQMFTVVKSQLAEVPTS